MRVTISAGRHDIVISDNLHEALESFFKNLHPFPARVMVIADENTHYHCFPLLSKGWEFEYELIVLEPGELNKNLETCTKVWNLLLDSGAGRDALIINLGGGVVTDTGGFIAATYMRGVKFINLPTSLLGMTDASAGGKTGVDLDGYKNMIGCFAFPETVIVHPQFLSTLPVIEWRNGMAEMIKHALITDYEYWKNFNEFLLTHSGEVDQPLKKFLISQLEQSIRVKAALVEKDPYDRHERKFLNFGHTVGHALETFSLQNDSASLTHGECVAIGMICEAHISAAFFAQSMEDVDTLVNAIIKYFKPVTIKEKNFNQLIQLMKSDKKSSGGVITMSLLKAIGNPVISEIDSERLIEEAFHFYNSFSQ